MHLQEYQVLVVPSPNIMMELYIHIFVVFDNYSYRLVAKPNIFHHDKKEHMQNRYCRYYQKDFPYIYLDLFLTHDTTYFVHID